MKKLEIHLADSLKVEGNIIDFRVYDGANFFKILRAAEGSDRKCYGLDTFTGLDMPNAIDNRHPNYNEIKKGQYPAFREATLRNVSTQSNKNFVLLKTNHYNDLESILPHDEQYCFALVDMKQYLPTKKVLNYIWDKITYGGTIYIGNYDEGTQHSEHVAVKEFIKEKWFEVNASRQMIVNGSKEKFIAIKCFPNHNKPENWKNIQPRIDKVTIAMVLKTGGEVYNQNYVNALAKAIKKNVTIDHEVVCLTDNPVGFSSDVDRVIPLTNGWPTWWNKIELFKPGQFTTESVFYLDLDTIIVDNIDKIVSYDGDFSGLRDFYALHSLGSGIMAWKPKKCEQIYMNFIQKSAEVIKAYKEGDQRWIDENKPSIEYIQDIYPNQIISYKRHCVDASGTIQIPEGAKIVCFHGNPRPHSVKNPDIMKYWQP